MRVLIIVASLSVVIACGGQPPIIPDGGEPDTNDAGTDAGIDAGTDTGIDAGMDAGIDAGTDAGLTPTPDAGVGPVGCVTTTTAGHHAFACDAITYEVEIPATCTAGGCGVVFDVHGATMTAAAEDKSTGLRAAATALNYIVVQPTAPLLFLARSWTPSIDDPKVWTFLQQLVTALVVNPKKIHFTGFSQGGAMTWRMLCAHADVLASIAPVAAADGQSLSPSAPPFVLDCPFTTLSRPSTQVPILQMHGTADGLVPFSKGQQQRDAVISAWSLTGPTTVASDAKFAHTRYVSPSGTVMEFIQHDYAAPGSLLLVNLGGHCLPGGADLPPNGTLSTTLYFSCVQPNAFVWGQQVMQFFVAHPKP